jgi:hypothetical protein
MQNNENTNPPKAPLVLRIGVSGHRPEPENLPLEKRKREVPDVPALQQTIHAALEAIRDTFQEIAATGSHYFDLSVNPYSQPGGGVLRIVSALASGADQWVAQIATQPDLQFELQCILPFHRDQYVNDFTDIADIELFNKLLKQASSILELDGKVNTNGDGIRKPDNHSYETVGRALLNQTDILIAVWDGKDAGGKGGTGQVVKEALVNGIPVIRVPWNNPEKWSLLSANWQMVEDEPYMEKDASHLSGIIKEILLPPQEVSVYGLDSGKSLRSAYFSETRKKGNLQHGIWFLFRNIITGDIFTHSGIRNVLSFFRVDDFETDEARKSEKFWKIDAGGRPYRNPLTGIQNWVDERYSKHYAWANGLSIYYGNMHRSAFVLNCLLIAFAAFLSLICKTIGITGKLQIGWILLEIVAILGILAIPFRDKKIQWHNRWIDYRTLAEYLRLSRYLILIGGVTIPKFNNVHSHKYSPAHTWMLWLYRAIERAAGVPNVCFTGDYLSSFKDLIRDGLVEGQIRYHKVTFRRFEKMDKRLHRMGDWLFVSALLACVIHLLHIWIEEDFTFSWIPANLSNWMTLLCIFLPALGAAFSEISSRGEIKRVSLISAVMVEKLGELQWELAKTPVNGEMMNSLRLKLCCDRIGEIIIREIYDWRVVFQDRPQGLLT